MDTQTGKQTDTLKNTHIQSAWQFSVHLKTMSDDAEQQAEEIEVLKSIYEGDDNFKQVDPKTYQYKVSMEF